MAFDAIFGGLLGGIARLAPEVLGYFDKKNERKHELALGDQQYKLVQLQGDNKLRTDQIAADSAQMTEGLKAIQDAYASSKTGFKFADTINALMRPWITSVVVAGWITYKVGMFMQLFHGDWAAAAIQSWTDNDWAMLGGVTNFWFLSRVFEKK